MQASFVAAPAAICGEADCSGSGTASAPLSIEVRPSGWGGDAGFLYGAPYSLVLLVSDEVAAMHANVSLRTHAGRELYRGTFDRHACRNATAAEAGYLGGSSTSAAGSSGRACTAAAPCAGRRRLTRTSAEGNGTGRSRGTAAARRRLARRQTWWSLLQGVGELHRVREGAGAHWGGRTPVDGGGGVRCADWVVPAGTLVALQGDCNRASGPNSVRLASPMLRAELGATFELGASDFPLYLTVLSADVAMRGSHGAALHAPQMYFTFHTAEVDWGARWALWLAAPLGFVAALGCCCLCLCLCCRRGRPLPTEVVQKGVASGGCHSRVDATAGFDSFEQIELST